MIEQQHETQLVPVEIKSVDEPWTVINLLDGTIIKTKIVVTTVSAVYDTNGKHIATPDGKPAYVIEHAMVHQIKASPLLLQETTGVRQ